MEPLNIVLAHEERNCFQTFVHFWPKKNPQLFWINAAVMQSQQREAVRRQNREDQRHLWKISNIQSMKKATNALPSLKFCTKIFLQRLFQLLPAAQARSPPQRPGATVCSW